MKLERIEGRGNYVWLWKSWNLFLKNQSDWLNIDSNEQIFFVQKFKCADAEKKTVDKPC